MFPINRMSYNSRWLMAYLLATNFFLSHISYYYVLTLASCPQARASKWQWTRTGASPSYTVAAATRPWT